MSELRRWSAEDATPEERRLLEASRGERPDPAARARTLLALGIGAPPGGGPASGSGGATGATVAAKLLALGAGALALGAVIVVGVVRTRHGAGHPHAPRATEELSGRTPVTPVAAASPVPALTAREPGEGGASKETPPPEQTPTERPKPARHAQRTARAAHADAAGSPSLEPSLAEEVMMLDRARAGLAAGDAPAALRSLDAYRARFAHGKLAAEEVVLRVQALLARGDRAGAAAVERSFSTAHPDSPYVARLRALVGADDGDGEQKK